MSKKLYVSFLWHMHQPYYKDDHTNKIGMPWVFLHAIKDYYDMPYYLQKHNKIKATFNLVPSLLVQIEDYANHTANDKLLDALKKEVSTLSEYEIAYLMEYLFLSNYENMIKPLQRYYELYLQYKQASCYDDLFTLQEILDLEVLFLLSWCGNYLRENNALVKALLYQEANFTHLQKIELLNELYAFMKTIVPYYKKLEESGQIAISTTPFYHPILPLLIDKKSAKEARNDVLMPNSEASYKDLASLQVKEAIIYHENTFGKKPNGFWPSEGSVSFETIKLLTENDIKWACSDEEILHKTIYKSKKESLYYPYRLNTGNKSINLFFRDKYLSDLIGFEYSSKEAKSAAKDFVSHLHSIYLNSNESQLASVILDGENAWEYYPNNAEDFFEELYSLLEKQEWCQTILFDDVESYSDLQVKEISHIASGSWISGNFDIWIGSSEKNRAWELLDMTKNAYDLKKDFLDVNTKKQIEKEFMQALGSDWFWWYGDDHYTVLKSKFDKLFRKHLKNIFRLMEEEIPLDILLPIADKNPISEFHTKPTQNHQPIIDGLKSDFYEWLYSGYINLKKDFSTMDTSALVIEGFYYSSDDENNLYFLFKGAKIKSILNEGSLNLYLNNEKYRFKLTKGLQEFDGFTVGIDEYIEIKVNATKDQKTVVAFELFKEELKVQFAPINKEIILDFEIQDFQKWYV
ncbi:MAG: glycoside hydrolase family 57 protein [Arcobacteraceae bacterium]